MHSSSREQVKQIRKACAELHLDKEMTALILGSHQHDRVRHTLTTDDQADVRSYVERKFALWERIFDAPTPGSCDATDSAPRKSSPPGNAGGGV